MKLTAEELLSGAACTRDVAVPTTLLASNGNGNGEAPADRVVTLRALTVRVDDWVSLRTCADSRQWKE